MCLPNHGCSDGVSTQRESPAFHAATSHPLGSGLARGLGAKPCQGEGGETAAKNKLVLGNVTPLLHPLRLICKAPTEMSLATTFPQPRVPVAAAFGPRSGWYIRFSDGTSFHQYLPPTLHSKLTNRLAPLPGVRHMSISDLGVVSL